MDGKTIDTVGRLLFGDRYVSALADQLGVARHTVIGWVNGQWNCPPHQIEQLRALAQERIGQLKAVLPQLV
jgi:hypothetical protein